MFYEVDRDALTLLRAAKEHHERLEPREPFSDGTRVAPVLASCGARGSKARDAPLREDGEVPGGGGGAGVRGTPRRCTGARHLPGYKAWAGSAASFLVRYSFPKSRGRASMHVRYASKVVVISVVTPSIPTGSEAEPCRQGVRVRGRATPQHVGLRWRIKLCML